MIIKCSECGKEISDKAGSCPGCGSPVSFSIKEKPKERIQLLHVYDNVFVGSVKSATKVAVLAMQSLDYRVDNYSYSPGFAAFTTGISWGSWSGISGSIVCHKINNREIAVFGTAKQNVKGAQLGAFNFGGETQAKVDKIVKRMIGITRSAMQRQSKKQFENMLEIIIHPFDFSKEEQDLMKSIDLERFDQGAMIFNDFIISKLDEKYFIGKQAFPNLASAKQFIRQLEGLY